MHRGPATSRQGPQGPLLYRLTVAKLPRMPLEGPAQGDVPQEGEGEGGRARETPRKAPPCRRGAARDPQPLPDGTAPHLRVTGAGRSTSTREPGGLAVHTPRRLGAWEPAHASRSGKMSSSLATGHMTEACRATPPTLSFRACPGPRQPHSPAVLAPLACWGDQSPRCAQA